MAGFGSSGGVGGGDGGGVLVAMELGRGVGEVWVNEEGSVVGSDGDEVVGVERSSSNVGRRSSGSGEQFRQDEREG